MARQRRRTAPDSEDRLVSYLQDQERRTDDLIRWKVGRDVERYDDWSQIPRDYPRRYVGKTIVIRWEPGTGSAGLDYWQNLPLVWTGNYWEPIGSHPFFGEEASSATGSYSNAFGTVSGTNIYFPNGGRGGVYQFGYVSLEQKPYSGYGPGYFYTAIYDPNSSTDTVIQYNSAANVYGWGSGALGAERYVVAAGANSYVYMRIRWVSGGSGSEPWLHRSSQIVAIPHRIYAAEQYA